MCVCFPPVRPLVCLGGLAEKESSMSWLAFIDEWCNVPELRLCCQANWEVQGVGVLISRRVREPSREVVRAKCYMRRERR